LQVYTHPYNKKCKKLLKNFQEIAQNLLFLGVVTCDQNFFVCLVVLLSTLSCMAVAIDEVIYLAFQVATLPGCGFPPDSQNSIQASVFRLVQLL